MESALNAITIFVAPLFLGGLIILFGTRLGFVFSEFFGWRSILSLFLILVVASAAVGNPAGWVTLVAFLIIIGVSATRFFTGPIAGSQILFTGFYDVPKPDGRLSRTGLAKTLDADFLNVFEGAIRNHGIQNHSPIAVRAFTPPALIHSWCNDNRFTRLVSRYSDRGLGTVWGVVDAGGITSLNVKLNRRLSARNPKAQEQVDRVVKILNSSDLLPGQKSRYLATVLAAIWCQSFCNDIAYRGDWEAARSIATESRRMIERALHEVEANPRQKRALTLLSKCYCQTHAFQ
jgi:hypothetical protein